MCLLYLRNDSKIDFLTKVKFEKMNKLLIITLLSIFSAGILTAQRLVDVTEQTIKLGGLKEEELYFGFAEGDKIFFNFEEMNGKTLTEVEILEYPNNSKFLEYKALQISSKTIAVNAENVYIFRLKNSSILSRICKVKIQRLPANSETANFNSTVVWKTRQETTYRNYTKSVLVGYDTVYVPKTEKELVKTEHIEELLLDRTEKVHSQTNINNFRTAIFVNLPQNEWHPYLTKKIIAWAYWIGVNQAGKEAWDRNVRDAAKFTSHTVRYTNPLAGVALGYIANLYKPTSGEDVAYYFITDRQNAELFKAGHPFLQFEQGKGTAAYGKRTDRLQGSFYIGLENDNALRAIDVDVKVLIIWELQYFQDRQYIEMKINPRYEKKLFTEPIVKTLKVPVIVK
jgi:hypothetical protein